MIENPQVGMRVRVTGHNTPCPELYGELATICHVPGPDDTNRVGLDFGRNVFGHECPGRDGRSHCPPGHGWYVELSEVMLDSPWEPAVGMRVRVDGLIPDIRYTVTGTGVVEDFSASMGAGRGALQPWQIRFDPDTVIFRDDGSRSGAAESGAYRLWCPRDILFPIEREVVVDADAGRVTLFSELQSCAPVRGQGLPDHLREASLGRLAQHVLDVDSQAVTDSENERLYALMIEIQSRLLADSTTGLVMTQLFGRDRL